jgi:hypothetical protein
VLAAAVILILPGAALAAAPTAETAPAATVYAGGPSWPWTERLSGTVTTGDLDTTYFFQYALTSDAFCTSQGQAGTPSSSASQIVAGGFVRAGVSIDVPGLTDGASYCYRFVATNADGTGTGSLYTFTYTPPAPSITSAGLLTTGATTALVQARVWPNGDATTVEVAYDVEGSPYCSTPRSGQAAFETSPIAVAAGLNTERVTVTLTGLDPGRGYCARLVATNASGTTIGAPFPDTFTAGVPLAQPTDVVAIGRTAALLTASVDPVGQATRYLVAYDVSGSTWCQSGGALGTPAHATSGLPLSFTDTGYHAVKAEVSGLAPRRSYCAAVEARNGSGATFAGAPSPLPAMPKVTLDVVSGGALLGTGSSSVVLSPRGIVCAGQCSASFPRGTQLVLRAAPAVGWTFLRWNPPAFPESPDQSLGPGLENAAWPCTDAVALTCTVTLTNDATSQAWFNKLASPLCRIARVGPAVTRASVSVDVTCDLRTHVTLQGTLRVTPRKGPAMTVTLPADHPARSGTSWQLRLRLPHLALNAFDKGARASVSVTLTYWGSAIGTGQAVASVPRLRR